MRDRGAFMSINASLQQIAEVCRGFCRYDCNSKSKFAPLEHYNTLGYIIICITVLSVIMIYRVSTLVKSKTKKDQLKKASLFLLWKQRLR